MRNIILIAPPAGGKGTQSKLLKDEYQLTHISTGDLLRDASQKNDELGYLIKKTLDAGCFASDDIVLELLKKAISFECSNGYILDGFPRNLNQANKYVEMLEIVNELYGNGKNGFLEFLDYNRCYNLLQEATNSANISTPKQLISKIAVTERYKACEAVFEQIDFPYAVIKGAVLSQTIYNDPFIRSSADIDLVIRREDIDSFKNLLQKNGFVQGRVVDGKIKQYTRQEIIFQNSMTHQSAPYIKATGNKLLPYIIKIALLK